MKVSQRSLFSFAVSDTEYFNDNQPKFEIVSCRQEDKYCKKYLPLINKYYLKSQQYRRDKDYHRSIDTLKDAYYVIAELNDSPCNKCSDFFRLTITESLENIQEELHKMSVGLFGTKRYHSCYVKSGNVLEEFKNASGLVSYCAAPTKQFSEGVLR